MKLMKIYEILLKALEMSLELGLLFDLKCYISYISKYNELFHDSCHAL